MALSLSSLQGLAFPQANINSDVTGQLSALGDAIKSGRQLQSLADLGKKVQSGEITWDQAAAGALAAGDRAGAMSLAQLGTNQAQREYRVGRDAINDKFRADQAARAQRNADRSYGLQERAANRADEDQFSVQKVENPDGTTSLVRVAKRGPVGVINTGQVTGGGNPFSPGKFTSEQGKAAGFTDRMLQSEGILSGVGSQGGVQDQGTSALQSGLSAIPGVGNFLIGKDRQKYEQAKRNFINAQLRRESGAAIAPSEFDSANRQYFPMPGDSTEVIEQKAANRRAAIEAMGREGGPSYRPKLSFDQSGHLTEYRPQQGRQSQRGITQEQYNALPSGATYTAPDGTQRVKR